MQTASQRFTCLIYDHVTIILNGLIVASANQIILHIFCPILLQIQISFKTCCLKTQSWSIEANILAPGRSVCRIQICCDKLLMGLGGVLVLFRLLTESLEII